MTKRSIAGSIASLGIGLLSLAAVPFSAYGQSADLVLCDRIAADPSDPDKPTDVKGAAEIAPSDIPTAIKFCKTASTSSRRALLRARPRLCGEPTDAGSDRRLAQSG
jgi:uncharacterized protein